MTSKHTPKGRTSPLFVWNAWRQLPFTSKPKRRIDRVHKHGVVYRVRRDTPAFKCVAIVLAEAFFAASRHSHFHDHDRAPAYQLVGGPPICKWKWEWKCTSVRRLRMSRSAKGSLAFGRAIAQNSSRQFELLTYTICREEKCKRCDCAPALRRGAYRDAIIAPRSNLPICSILWEASPTPISLKNHDRSSVAKRFFASDSTPI